MHSLKALAQSTLGELKDALVDAVGDDEEEEELADEPVECEAAKEFKALQDSPFLERCLQRLGPEKAELWRKERLELEDLASLSCWTLRQLLPLVPLEANEAQRLLSSFGEKYEALFAEHQALQRRSSEAKSELDSMAQQAETWRTAHQAAIERLEELSSKNAELREELKLREQELASGERTLKSKRARRRTPFLEIPTIK